MFQLDHGYSVVEEWALYAPESLSVLVAGCDPCHHLTEVPPTLCLLVPRLGTGLESCPATSPLGGTGSSALRHPLLSASFRLCLRIPTWEMGVGQPPCAS